jgi:hypothetical protein
VRPALRWHDNRAGVATKGFSGEQSSGEGGERRHRVSPDHHLMRERPTELRVEVQAAVVEFLRDWLPPHVQRAYRDLIRDDPANWFRHPHFSRGVIVNDALRGNGYDESALGVDDLEPLWPELVRLAVEEISEPEPPQ